MVSKNNLLYIIGAIIYIACFGYIIHDMLQAPEGEYFYLSLVRQ